MTSLKDAVFKFDSRFIKENYNVAIGNDFIVLDDISDIPFFDYPAKIDVAVASICLKGEIEGAINLRPYRFSVNDFFTTLPGQILQYNKVSSDFSGIHIIMSQHFLDSLKLSIRDTMSVLIYLERNPVVNLNSNELNYLHDYYNMIVKAVLRAQNPCRMEVVKALTVAMFYEMDNFQQLYKNKVVEKSKNEELFDSFYNLVLCHHRESHKVGFYANRLFLTPKYLSALIKEITGKSAFQWINDYVVLEAQSMLMSTNMTIQQISDELNFANQSFFGKYFKQHIGMSPSEYRLKKY